MILIYIPIWLDLLYKSRMPTMLGVTDLHSNMVRFIIQKEPKKREKIKKIYIPIWLDLLLKEK